MAPATGECGEARGGAAMAEATGGPSQEEMHEEEVLACAFGEWYDRFLAVTFRSEVLPLPEAFVRYLLADGIRPPAGGADGASAPAPGSDSSSEQDTGAGEEDDDEDEEARFPELEEQVARAIERLSGAVMPKLNWSAPKDALWIHGSLRCTTPQEIFMLLKASDFVAHDLCHSFDHCATSRTRPDEFTLVLRRWHEVHESAEFRCFASGSRLRAVSQRQTSAFYEHLAAQGETDELLGTILAFFEEHIAGKFTLPRYAVDLAVGGAPQRRARLVDFSPWGPTTDPCLFDWQELGELAGAPEGPLELRVVRGEADRRGRPERYHQLPLELAALGRGVGLEELLWKADALLERQRREEPREGGG